MISPFPFTSPHKPHRLVDWSIVLVLIPTHGTPAPSQPGQPAANANNFIKIHRHRNNENIKCCIRVERQNMKYKQNGKKHSSRHDYTLLSPPRLQTLAGFWRLPSKKLYITLAKWSEAGRCGVVEVAECGKYLEARENI